MGNQGGNGYVLSTKVTLNKGDTLSVEVGNIGQIRGDSESYAGGSSKLYLNGELVLQAGGGTGGYSYAICDKAAPLSGRLVIAAGEGGADGYVTYHTCTAQGPCYVAYYNAICYHYPASAIIESWSPDSLYGQGCYHCSWTSGPGTICNRIITPDMACHGYPVAGDATIRGVYSHHADPHSVEHFVGHGVQSATPIYSGMSPSGWNHVCGHSSGDLIELVDATPGSCFMQPGLAVTQELASSGNGYFIIRLAERQNLMYKNVTSRYLSYNNVPCYLVILDDTVVYYKRR